MSASDTHPDQVGAEHLRQYNSPRALITGACRGFGRICAELLAVRGARLILCDKDAPELHRLARALGAAAFPCDVSSEASVKNLAAAISEKFPSLDMIVNSAGGGYERSLGMYRVSRALLPALDRGFHKLIINIPPFAREGEKAIFPYASSCLAFERLSSAIAMESRGMAVTIFIACPATRLLIQALPDANAGIWAHSCSVEPPSQEDVRTLAWKTALLFGKRGSSRHQHELSPMLVSSRR